MTQTLLKSETRTGRGKGPARQLRLQGKVPGNLYCEGKESIPIALDAHQVKLWLARNNGDSLIVGLDVDGGNIKQALLKEVQQHPVNDKLLHIDFFETAADRQIKVTVPVRTLGTPIGVAQAGGNLDNLVRTLEILTLPGDMPESFDIDISDMDVGEMKTVADIKIDPKFTLLTSADIGVVSISAPRVSGKGSTDKSEAEAAEGEEKAEK